MTLDTPEDLRDRPRTTSFRQVCAMLAARRCHDAGMPVEDIAQQARKNPSTIRRWIATTGKRLAS